MNKYDVAAKIHRDVNKSVEYKKDLEQYSLPDYWTIAGKYGDCEDYALLKRARLLEIGWDSDKLGLCICFTETNEGHCVLYVNTDKGAFILDNRYSNPATPSLLPYKWDSMLCNGKWYQLSGWQ